MNVSIIIPAYNSAPTIADALESVIAQTCPNWESVIVDDGSTDATAEIAGAFAARHARIRMIRQKNGGESAARNTGIGQARYDWLLFLDADDWIAPTHLERLTGELISNPELDAVHCGSVRVALDGTQVADNYLPPAGDMFPTLARRAAFPVNACIVRRSLVEAVGKFDTSLKKCPDWDLWQRIARTGARFGAVREVLAYYRMLPNSSSLDAEQLLADGLTVLKRGHAPDGRVTNPHPDYADGLQEKVESQAYYLLCWSAGLVLGRGKDARRLLKAVKDQHHADLYPDAIAQCIFDAATLPTCRPRQGWETLWPKTQGLAEKFLVALEEHSKTPDLTRRALAELKKMVLKHSLTWGVVIDQADQTMATQRSLIEELDQGRAWFEEDRNKWQRRCEELKQEKASLRKDLEASQGLAEQLNREKASLQKSLEASQALVERLNREKVSLQKSLEASQKLAQGLEQDKTSLQADHQELERLAEDREFAIRALQEQSWVRLGSRLKMVKQPDSVAMRRSPPVKPEGCFNEEETKEGKWHLRVAGGSIARLMFPPGHPEVVRIAIAKAKKRTPWDIQLNQPGLKVKASHPYSVYFRARAERPRRISVGFSKAYEPWSNLGLYEKINLTPKWQSFQQDFTALADDDNARIHFDVGDSNIAVELSAVSLHRLEGRSVNLNSPPAEAGEPKQDGGIVGGKCCGILCAPKLIREYLTLSEGGGFDRRALR